MIRAVSIGAIAVATLALSAGASLAGVVVPAPLLGAGLPGLAVLAAGGVGYLAVRAWRRRKG